VRKADNLPPSCAVVTKSKNLNCLEPSGPVTGLVYSTVWQIMLHTVHIMLHTVHIMSECKAVKLVVGLREVFS